MTQAGHTQQTVTDSAKHTLHALASDKLTRDMEAAKMKHSMMLQKFEAEQRAKELDLDRELKKQQMQQESQALQQQQEMQRQQMEQADLHHREDLAQKTAFAHDRNEKDLELQQKNFENMQRANQESEERRMNILRRLGFISGEEESEEGGGKERPRNVFETVDQMQRERDEINLQQMRELAAASGDIRVVTSALRDTASSLTDELQAWEQTEAFATRAGEYAMEWLGNTDVLSAFMTEGSPSFGARGLKDGFSGFDVFGARQNLAGTFTAFNQTLEDEGLGQFVNGQFWFYRGVTASQVRDVMDRLQGRWSGQAPGQWGRIMTGHWFAQNFSDYGDPVDPAMSAGLLLSFATEQLGHTLGLENEQFNMGPFAADFSTLVDQVMRGGGELSAGNVRKFVERVRAEEGGNTAVMLMNSVVSQLATAMRKTADLGRRNQSGLMKQIEEQTGRKVDGRLVARMTRQFGEIAVVFEQMQGMLHESGVRTGLAQKATLDQFSNITKYLEGMRTEDLAKEMEKPEFLQMVKDMEELADKHPRMRDSIRNALEGVRRLSERQPRLNRLMEGLNETEMGLREAERQRDTRMNLARLMGVF